jgi:hypothetical protein
VKGLTACLENSQQSTADGETDPALHETHAQHAQAPRGNQETKPDLCTESSNDIVAGQFEQSVTWKALLSAIAKRPGR